MASFFHPTPIVAICDSDPRVIVGADQIAPFGNRTVSNIAPPESGCKLTTPVPTKDSRAVRLRDRTASDGVDKMEYMYAVNTTNGSQSL